VSDSESYRPRTFDASITDPDGIEVHVTVRVPAGAMWPAEGGRFDSNEPVGEAAEVAQVSAVQAINQIAKYKGRPPF
jgi:hypothetical protein